MTYLYQYFVNQNDTLCETMVEVDEKVVKNSIDIEKTMDIYAYPMLIVNSMVIDSQELSIACKKYNNAQLMILFREILYA